MTSANNLAVFVFALFPIVMYVYMLYFLIPYQFVSIHRSRRYLISGLMSPFLIFLFYFILPWWGDPVGSYGLFRYLFYGIVQIGFLEEFSKFIVFQWVTSERISTRHDLPVATMFYSLMTSLGFALTENLSYIISLYQVNMYNPVITSTELKNSMIALAASRSLTAVVMHMICGVILGYFISKSKNNSIRLSFAGMNYVSNDLRVPKLTHLVMGIGIAALYHGIYDVNLMLPDNNYKILFTVTIILFGLLLSYFMTKSLIEESKGIRKMKLN